MTIEHITGSYPPNGKAIKHDRPMIPREVLEILKRPQVEMISIVYDHGAGPRFDLYKKERDSVKWIYETLRIETNGTREPFDKLLNAEIKSRAGAEVVSFILEESYRGRLYRDFLIRIPVPTEEGSHEPGETQDFPASNCRTAELNRVGKGGNMTTEKLMEILNLEEWPDKYCGSEWILEIPQLNLSAEQIQSLLSHGLASIKTVTDSDTFIVLEFF